MSSTKCTLILSAVALWCVAFERKTALADLIIPSYGARVVVDFSAFSGVGFSPTPSPGQLDSTTWRVGGFSDGTLSYGGTGVTGDFARGTSSGGVTSGGLYAFEVAAGDRALGVQPTGTDFNPGFVELRVRNSVGTPVSDWGISYDNYFRNDQGRGSSWNLSYSTDGVAFTNVPVLDFTSPDAGNATRFDKAVRSGLIAAAVPNEGQLFFRWSSNDVSGTGSRDELAMDNVAITATASTSLPEPGSFVLMGVGLLVLLGYRCRMRLRTAPERACKQLNAARMRT